MRGEAARNRRTGARREGRIEAIDIKRQIGFPAADGLGDLLRHLGGAHLMHLVGIEDTEPECPLAMECGADADLDRSPRIDDSIADSIVEHGAVIDAVAVIGLDISMGIEMHQRQGAMHFGMRLQQGIRDEMVAAEGDEFRPLLDHGQRMVGDRVGNRFLAAPIEETIAIIDDGQRVEGIEHPRPIRPPGMFDRCLADRFGPEAGAGPVAHRLIERDAGDGDIDAGKVTRIFAPHIGQGTGIGSLELGAFEIFAAKGAVPRNRGQL